MQLDVCAVFAWTTNYTLGRSPFEIAGPLNLRCPYLCNKQFVLSVFWDHRGPWMLNYPCGSWARFYVLKPEPGILSSSLKGLLWNSNVKLLLIFLNLDFQLKDFPQPTFMKQVFLLWSSPPPIKNSISFPLLTQTYHLIFPLLTESCAETDCCWSSPPSWISYY